MRNFASKNIFLIVIFSLSSYAGQYDIKDYTTKKTGLSLEGVLKNLDDVFNGNDSSKLLKQFSISELREKNSYIRKVAFDLGVKIGVLNYKNKIKEYLSLSHVKRKLDKDYPFERFLFNANYLPPVIAYQENTMALNKDATIMRSTKFIFKKIKKAKIVIVAPTWRDYFILFRLGSNVPLNLDYYLNSASTPYHKEELKTWKEQLRKGFDKGALYIEDNFKLSLNKMDRDFKGYLLFYMLQDQGIIRPVKIQVSSKEYILRKNELRIGDKVFKVLESNFQIDEYIKRLKAQERQNKTLSESNSPIYKIEIQPFDEGLSK